MPMQPPDIVPEMIRHLPPSSAPMTILVIENGHHAIAAIIQLHRSDARIVNALGKDFEAVLLNLAKKALGVASFDAVLLYKIGTPLLVEPLAAKLFSLLRAGGRLIAFDEADKTPQAAAESLQGAGFVRVLGELLAPGSILYRGEVPYEASLSTLGRVAISAQKDVATAHIIGGAAIQALKGSYLFIPVHQTPNKPVWRLAPGETIEWMAVPVEHQSGRGAILAFTSLPKAVQFLQHVLPKNSALDIQKIPKFSKVVVATWPFALALNIEPDSFGHEYQLSQQIVYLDPASAETPDE